VTQYSLRVIRKLRRKRRHDRATATADPTALHAEPHPVRSSHTL